ncbi:MAG TPA: histidine phosphatase family protein, partial [Candidatus Hydrogenedentes bacterium]|nr:histidine phosphatase family protein [Candidatus Hydrogenedentota bacterium]
MSFQPPSGRSRAIFRRPSDSSKRPNHNARPRAQRPQPGRFNTARLRERLRSAAFSRYDACSGRQYLVRLLIVRHAQSEGNVEGPLSGSTDPPLTPRGLWQAELTGRRLAAEDLSALYCGPLWRNLQTAER